MSDPLATPTFFTRSHASQDWTCARSRYWAYEHEGLGISPARRALYFDVGDAIHKGIAPLIMCVGESQDVIDTVLAGFRASLALTDLSPEKTEEQACLVEGLLWGFVRLVLPKLLEEFTFLTVEEEFPREVAEGVVMGTKPDTLGERKSDRTLWYWEWKTTGSLGPKWFPQWQRAIQLHTTALNVGVHLERAVEGVVVQGLYKGFEKDGKQTSILCYAYERAGTVRGPEILYQWRAGSRRVPVWELRGGVKKWVYEMPTEILQEQFAQTPPIFLQTRLVEAFLRQRVQREREIALAKEALGRTSDPQVRLNILDKVFPQNFNACTPAFGNGCAWGDCCWNVSIAEDPLRSGLFTLREPHHAKDPAWALRARMIEGGK